MEPLEIDFLILADRAEAINGKLYTMGAAWDRIGVNDFRQPLTISIALAILVPWLATNQQHQVTLTLRDVDGHPVDFRVEASFIAGRPAQVDGEIQRILLAIPAAPVVLPGPGGYVMAAAIDGVECKTVRFTATIGPAPAAP